MKLSLAIQSLRIVGYEVKDDCNWLGLAKILKINTNPKTVQYEVSNCIRAKKYVHSLENQTVSKTLQGMVQLRRAINRPIGSRPPKRTGSEQEEYVKSSAFLKSQAWKTLRARVRNYYKDVCMKCLVTGGYVKNSEINLQVDHIIPRKVSPALALDFDNLQILCGCCNKEKGNKNRIDYRKPEFIRAAETEDEIQQRLLDMFK